MPPAQAGALMTVAQQGLLRHTIHNEKKMLADDAFEQRPVAVNEESNMTHIGKTKRKKEYLI